MKQKLCLVSGGQENSLIVQIVKRVALFRFHSIHNIDDIIARVCFFKKLNPNVEVYGLFGGNYIDYKSISSALTHVFSSICFWDESDLDLKWRSSDVAYQVWYNQVGQELEFDVLHPIEWDLVFMDSLENLFSNMPKSALACTGLIPLHYIEDSWYWVANEKMNKEWRSFFDSIVNTSICENTIYAIQGPALIIPRAYLEGIGSLSIPHISNDELRIPLYAQLLNIDLVDNGLFQWGDEPSSLCFNCNKFPVPFSKIKNEMALDKGCRVFHPYIDKFEFNKFLSLI